MAITKILARKGRLDVGIRYVLNGDKTQEQILTAHLNCDPGRELRQMLETKAQYGKEDGVQYYHIIQSFRPGEVSPELALEIARTLVEEHMYNKIRANADIVLKPALTQLDDLERALQRENPAMLEINQAIAQVAEQSHNISKLQTAGLLDADACTAKLSSIQTKLTQLRRERRRLLEHDDIEDAISRLHQTADTIKFGPEQLDM